MNYSLAPIEKPFQRKYVRSINGDVGYHYWLSQHKDENLLRIYIAVIRFVSRECHAMLYSLAQSLHARKETLEFSVL